MCLNVTAAQIRDRSSIAPVLSIKNQATLPGMPPPPKFATSQKEPEFKHHVEAGKMRFWIQLHEREVVNTVLAFANHLEDLLHSLLGAGIAFQGTTCFKTESHYREDNRVKYPAIGRVERAIDEDRRPVVRF